eukprot:951091-Pelagomonas_calceolata.AAC.2
MLHSIQEGRALQPHKSSRTVVVSLLGQAVAAWSCFVAACAPGSGAKLHGRLSRTYHNNCK